MQSNYIIPLFLILSSFLFGQNIAYSVSLRQIFSEKGLAELQHNTYDARKAFIEQNQFPPPTYYTLIVGERLSILNYVPALDNEQENTEKRVHIAPFGFSETIRQTERPNFLMKHPVLGKKVYSESPVLTIEWTNTNRDSIILGYKVSEAIGTDVSTHFKYTIWYSKQLPKNLGIYNLKHPDGFVLAFTSVLHKPDETIDMITITATPYKISRIKKTEMNALSKKIKAITPDQIYGQKEINEKYNTYNQQRNEMLK